MPQLVTATAKSRSGDAVIQYAVHDIQSILRSAGADTDATCPDWVFELDVDAELREGEFAVRCEAASRRVSLLGYDCSCALHAAYTALERAGIVFDITGPVMPSKLDMGALDGWSTTIQPTVKRRGIRQHINFPMDVSSYSLDEAREYIRNLARMRMNAITFHSYPGQWYAARLDGLDLSAGGFFYTRKHIVPDHPAFKGVRNDKIYCIPEIEPFYDDEAKRSEAAIAWLREVISEAKRVGMDVQFSFEPRDEPVEAVIATAESILANYPMIDRLELMTQECGLSWDASVYPTTETLKEQVIEAFGPDALDESVLACVKEGLSQIPVTLRELAKNARVIAELKERWAGKGPKVVAGVYCTEHASLNLALALMRKYVPQDTEISFLPAHGARASADSVAAMDFSAEDFRRTMIHTWIEFDGDMFLQENTVLGTHQMIESIGRVLGRERIEGLFFNHWRTAENRTGARYAALACVDGSLGVDEFYAGYAASLGIGEAETYRHAMQLVDDADTDARNRLGNIGFCFEGCWWIGSTKIGYAGDWKAPMLDEVRVKFEEAGEMLARCLAATESQAGRDCLSLIVNRLDCTSLHLRAMAKLTELRAVCGDAEFGTLDDDRQARVREICDAAFAIAEQYAYKHAEALVDRGCEGNLVSYYDTIWMYISKLRERFGGEGYFESGEASKSDAPPPPAI